MDILHITVLALIQGLTEFLPVSSSAHLILPSALLGWPDQGLAFDVAVHFGSLLAVIFYYRQKLMLMAKEFYASFGKAERSEPARQAWVVLYATIPAMIVGLIVNQFEHMLRSGLIIAFTTIFFAFFLAWADRRAASKQLTEMSLKQGLIIGFCQCLALIPGTSRSGITMTTALALGFRRDVAAEFSFLLSIPLIGAAASLKALELMMASGPVDWTPLILGLVLSAVSAYACITLFMNLISRIGFMPFVFYRFALGALLFYVLW